VSDVSCPTPFGIFELHRAPLDRTGTLRAWDGADLLLLDHVALIERNGNQPLRVLVIGDNFGALCVAIAATGANVVAVSDSIVAEHAIVANLGRNESALRADGIDTVELRSSLQDVELHSVDVVVWNVDRVTDLVTEIASSLSRVCHGTSVVFAAGMDKHLPPQTAHILRRVGTVTTHPGRRKAHLFEVHVPDGEANLRSIDSPTASPVAIAEYNLAISALPGVFSADRFDVGTRLLAHQIQSLHGSSAADDIDHVVDLGCGAGTLGVLALQALPRARVTFVDESARAMVSATRNVLSNLGDDALARSVFVRSDVFSQYNDHNSAPIDLIVCNPPFHHVNSMTDEVAWQMFQQSHARLRPGGEIWVVGNRHLGYHDKLQRIFGNVRHMSPHPKFVVLGATR
jgi:23S rRNA (guanine1835-N2)-methyltransferase